MNITELLDKRRDQIERFVITQLSARHDPEVKELGDAIALALSGGKRIRGFLVMEGARLGGFQPEDVMPTAAAVEAFHAYSLVHDDLPSMDDAMERRGRPTIHVEHDEATAILVGDSLIPLGFRWICDEQAKNCSSAAIIDAMQLFARVLGTEFLTGGQHLDLKGAKNKQALFEMMRRKTGGLIQASLVAGGLLSEMEQKNLRLLEHFGEKLGLAFQLMDDLLDWNEDGYSEIMGKEEVRHLARTTTREAIEIIDEIGDRAAVLRELTEHLGERTA